jgi:hypothetical protein
MTDKSIPAGFWEREETARILPCKHTYSDAPAPLPQEQSLPPDVWQAPTTPPAERLKRPQSPSLDVVLLKIDIAGEILAQTVDAYNIVRHQEDPDREEKESLRSSIAVLAEKLEAVKAQLAVLEAKPLPFQSFLTGIQKAEHEIRMLANEALDSMYESQSQRIHDAPFASLSGDGKADIKARALNRRLWFYRGPGFESFARLNEDSKTYQVAIETANKVDAALYEVREVVNEEASKPKQFPNHVQIQLPFLRICGQHCVHPKKLPVMRVRARYSSRGKV